MEIKCKKKVIKLGFRKNRKLGAAVEENVVSEYKERLADVGRPLTCKVNVVSSKITGEFALLDVLPSSRTVSYPYENGGIGYKTLTHVLSNDIAAYGLSCSPDGEVEVYVLDDSHDVVYDSEFIGSMQVRHHVVDPVFAFASPNGIDVVFNDPTSTAIDSGTKARVPVTFPDEHIALASGCPVAVSFRFGEGEGRSILPAMDQMHRYVMGLLDDPNGDLPLVMVANILEQEEPSPEDEEVDEPSGPSFSTMMDALFPDVDDDVVKEGGFPIGISVARLTDAEPRFSQVAMSGNMEYGIRHVTIGKSEDGENNAVDIESAVV